MRSRVRQAAVDIARRRKINVNDRAGWNAISIRDIVAEANISIGTFYKYFADRDDLAQTLWTEPVGKLRAKIQVEYDAARDPADKVRVLLENYAGFARDNPRAFKFIFLSVRPEETPLPEPLALDEEPFFCHLCAAFRQGQEQGVFRDFDPRIMAQLFWAAIHGVQGLPINLARYRFADHAVFAVHMIDELLTLITNGRMSHSR